MDLQTQNWNWLLHIIIILKVYTLKRHVYALYNTHYIYCRIRRSRCKVLFSDPWSNCCFSFRVCEGLTSVKLALIRSRCSYISVISGKFMCRYSWNLILPLLFCAFGEPNVPNWEDDLTSVYDNAWFPITRWITLLMSIQAGQINMW